MNVPFRFVKSPSNAFVKSRAFARIAAPGPYCTWQMVFAEIGLAGFGPFTGWTGTITPGTTEMSGQTIYGPNASGEPYAVVLGQSWPAVYNTLTETWNMPVIVAPPGGTNYPGYSHTLVTSFSKYADQSQPNTPTGSSPGGILGTIASVSLSASSITITYTFNWLYDFPPDPIDYVTGTGTYTATLSGSLLNPTGTGPFDPTDATYGWAALTAEVEALLAMFPSAGVDKDYCSAALYQPISVSPGYQGGPLALGGGSGDNLPVPVNTSGFYATIGLASAAMHGFPGNNGSSWFTQEISDVPSTGNITTSNNNYGSCISAKSTWYFGAATWQDTTYYTEMNTVHSEVYAQTLGLSSSAITAGTVAASTTFPNPIPAGTIIKFEASDVIANIGSTNYGMLGFVSALW